MAGLLGDRLYGRAHGGAQLGQFGYIRITGIRRSGQAPCLVVRQSSKSVAKCAWDMAELFTATLTAEGHEQEPDKEEG